MPKDYKIRYKDGRVHTVSADKYDPGATFVHLHRDGSLIFSAVTPEIESIGLAEIADPALEYQDDDETDEPQRSGRVHSFP